MKIEITKSNIWFLFAGIGIGFSFVYFSMGDYIALILSWGAYIMFIVVWWYLLKFICRLFKIKNLLE
jgi:hypothetical protein